jgi:hypothetical protein
VRLGTQGETLVHKIDCGILYRVADSEPSACGRSYAVLKLRFDLRIEHVMPHTVEFEIGFIAEHSMILFLTYILKCTNPLWLASFQTPEFAYLPALECCT